MQKIILFLFLILIYQAGSQYLQVFDIDTTDYPIMRAKFCAFDSDGKQITNITESDFKITENGEERNVLSITCPNTKEPVAISSVLTIDVSGSMLGNSIEMAKETAKELCNLIVIPPSEIALLKCNTNSLILNDFTRQKNIALDNIIPIYAYGGNNFEEQLLNPSTGLLSIAKKGKYKRVAVIFTDAYWYAMPKSKVSECIQICQEHGIELYSVFYSDNKVQPDGIKSSLKQISESTGGKHYDGITTYEAAQSIAYAIQNQVQYSEPCEIEWESKLSCISNIINCKYSVPYLSQESTLNYFLSQNKVKRFAFEPSAILFFNKPLGERADTIITVTAQNSDFNIANITCSSSEFDINPKSFSLKKGESKQLTVSLIPTDKNYKYAVFNIENDNCNTKFSCFSKHLGHYGSSNPALNLTHPTGGEEFLVGSDTIISWEGIVPSDTVSLEYSYDDGKTWATINKTAVGLSHIWSNIPKPTSNKCKVRIRSNEAGNQSSTSEILNLAGHTNSVNYISWSPDGSKLATASRDKTGQIWDANSGTVVLQLIGHTEMVMHISWSPDGSKVATASWDATGRIWDANSGKMIHELSGHTAGVYHISWSPDGSKIATASYDKTGRIWDANSGKMIHELSGHTAGVEHISWSPDGSKIATASSDKTGRIWDANSGKMIHELSGHTARVAHISWSPDGIKIATASYDKTGRIWDANSSKMIHELSGHTLWVQHISWSPDGTKIATASSDQTGRIWDANSGKMIHELSGHTASVEHISWSPYGSQIATASRDRTGRIWDANSGKMIHELSGYISFVHNITWSPDGSRLATACNDNSCHIWNVNNGAQIHELSAHSNSVTQIIWSPDGSKVATASNDNSCRIWDASSGKQLQKLLGHTRSINNISWSPDGSKIATASSDDTGRIWDANSGVQLYELAELSHIIWSPDGSKISTAGQSSNIRIWEANSGVLIRELDAYQGRVPQTSWSPDGSKIATASDDSICCIWDVNSGLQLQKLSGHTNNINNISWSPNGRYIATASDDWTARIWDWSNGDQVHLISGITGPVNHVIWSPDGSKVATAGLSWWSTVFDLSTGKYIGGFNHSAYLVHISWSPDGSMLATASWDNSGGVWDVISGKKLRTLQGHTNGVLYISWSPDGSKVATASDDCSAKIWILDDSNSYDQEDVSDLFSIVAPEVTSQDINMGDVVVNSSKDSVVTEFIDNIGQWECRIDTIYFEGADADYFGLNGPNPVYSVAVGNKQMSEFKFSPTEVRDYAAQVVVITQADTLKQNIYGRGVEKQIAANAEIIDFGIHELYDYADSTVALIQNVTPNPIQITKIEMLGPDKEQFIFNDLTQIQAFTLAGNTDYSLNLRFNPKYIGRTSGQVAFHFNGAGSPAIAQLYGAGIGAELSASADTAYVGDVIGIDISFDNNDIAKFAEVIGSFEGVVRVESSILGTLHKENLVEIKADSAYIKFKGEINSASNIIATIPLKVALGRVESTSIDFEYVKWFDTEGNEIVYDTEFSSGFFKQLGICEDGGKRFFNPDGIVGISNLSPNPAENRIQIDFSVIEAGYTEITLVNMLGQTVATLFAEDISDFQDRQIIQDISEIGSGQYILQFKTPTYVERRKVMVVR